jgi:hypothetical protein
LTKIKGIEVTHHKLRFQVGALRRISCLFDGNLGDVNAGRCPALSSQIQQISTFPTPEVECGAGLFVLGNCVHKHTARFSPHIRQSRAELVIPELSRLVGSSTLPSRGLAQSGKGNHKSDGDHSCEAWQQHSR